MLFFLLQKKKNAVNPVHLYYDSVSKLHQTFGDSLGFLEF
jgi:hypothetical protein